MNYLKSAAIKNKYLSVLAVFLVCMYIMTFAEHYFEHNKVANADTCVVESHTLTHWLEGNGIVKGDKIIGYLTPAGKMLQKGDEMFVKAAGTDRVTLPIAQLSFDAKENLITVYFDIDPNDYEDGAQVIIIKQQETRKQPCIAVDAVHEDENGNHFVYLVQEKKSILGHEPVCRMKYIQVFLEDENYAAINPGDNGIKDTDMFVLHADRKISDGSRLHLLE